DLRRPRRGRRRCGALRGHRRSCRRAPLPGPHAAQPARDRSLFPRRQRDDTRGSRRPRDRTGGRARREPQPGRRRDRGDRDLPSQRTHRSGRRARPSRGGAERSAGSPRRLSDPEMTMHKTIPWLLASALAACSSEEPPPTPTYERLVDWGLFVDAPAQAPAEGVVPYEVIAPLYSDYTYKRRFVPIPPDSVVGYAGSDTWRFPVGTILITTFSYLHDYRDPSLGERLLETRLRVRDPETWT